MEITAEYLKQEIEKAMEARDNYMAQAQLQVGAYNGAIAMAELMLQRLAAEEVPASPNGEVRPEPPGEAEVLAAAEGDSLDG